MKVSERSVFSVPSTHTASIDFSPLAGSLGLTWMIWLDGGGGVWMQAPK